MVVKSECVMTGDNVHDVEIRKLSAGSIFKLSQLLEFGDGWKQLMAVIPVECVEGGRLKYTHDQMKLIENAGLCQKRPFSEILLEEWGTSGKTRPTVSFLLKCLLKAELYRAAEFVAVELLKAPPPPRPVRGPAAPVVYTSFADLTPSAPPDLEPSAPPPFSTELTQPEIDLQEAVSLPFTLLENATERFVNARLLGGGAGGSVYFARLPDLGAVAIKKLHEPGSFLSTQLDPHQQFINEVKVLAQLSHRNLLPLVGYSNDGPALCIAYRFMKNGSLLDRLACKDMEMALPWQLRIHIGIGAAQGLDYLHSYKPKAFVHRDVKSANILLDHNFTAKLGDFGLARHGSRGYSVAQTENTAGTLAYMAPEAHRGDVSVKMDVFSFGVVLLELLTGLPPHDETRDGHDLVTFVGDVDNRNDLLDMSAGEWPTDIADKLFCLSDACLMEKKNRPFICEVKEQLETCVMSSTNIHDCNETALM